MPPGIKDRKASAEDVRATVLHVRGLALDLSRLHSEIGRLNRAAAKRTEEVKQLRTELQQKNKTIAELLLRMSRLELGVMDAKAAKVRARAAARASLKLPPAPELDPDDIQVVHIVRNGSSTTEVRRSGWRKRSNLTVDVLVRAWNLFYTEGKSYSEIAVAIGSGAGVVRLFVRGEYWQGHGPEAYRQLGVTGPVEPKKPATGRKPKIDPQEAL